MRQKNTSNWLVTTMMMAGQTTSKMKQRHWPRRSKRKNWRSWTLYKVWRYYRITWAILARRNICIFSPESQGRWDGLLMSANWRLERRDGYPLDISGPLDRPDS